MRLEMFLRHKILSPHKKKIKSVQLSIFRLTIRTGEKCKNWIFHKKLNNLASAFENNFISKYSQLNYYFSFTIILSFRSFVSNRVLDVKKRSLTQEIGKWKLRRRRRRWKWNEKVWKSVHWRTAETSSQPSAAESAQTSQRRQPACRCRHSSVIRSSGATFRFEPIFC